ncbi:MAG: hypothetical protein MUE52_02695 [Tabrizicola sp.]|jgi:hypothetical protein|nr:hypothetical protein [Tabrizicola sp.]
MKVILWSDRQLILEDKPWLIGILMIAMALMFLGGSMALISAGEFFGGLMMGLIGVGVPLLIAALMVQRVRLVLDRDTGTISRTSRSIRGLNHATYALDRLTEARVGVSTDSDGTTYRMELHLSEPAEIVPFTSYYTSGRKPEQMSVAVNDWRMGRNGQTHAAQHPRAS